MAGTPDFAKLLAANDFKLPKDLAGMNPQGQQVAQQQPTGHTVARAANDVNQDKGAAIG